MITTDLSKEFHPVPKPLQKKKAAEKSVEKPAEIKKRSSKLAKLERDRDKDRIKSGLCDYCHKYSKRLDPHEVYGGSNRQRSIKNGFVKNLCRKCHDNPEIIKQLRIDVQKEYEKTHSRDEFIKITGKSYI